MKWGSIVSITVYVTAKQWKWHI